MTHYTIVGAGGFVGSHVVERLRATGYETWCPEREDPALRQRDLGRILYCAGLTGDFRTRPFATVEAHVSLLARLIEGASFERIVYLSSTRLYDALTTGIGEESRPIPVDPTNAEHLYELSKLLGENLTLTRSGGRGTVARLSYVFGWENSAQGFLSEWLRAAQQNLSITLDSSPGFARDYIHIEDAAAALIAMADGETSGIVNVARGETLSNEDIAAVFRKHGWKVQFSRGRTGPNRIVAINSTKLDLLGVPARPVLPLIDDFLGGLSNPLTEPHA